MTIPLKCCLKMMIMPCFDLFHVLSRFHRKDGPEYKFRVIHRLNNELHGSDDEVQTLVFDQCFIVEAYVLTYTRMRVSIW